MVSRLVSTVTDDCVVQLRGMSGVQHVLTAQRPPGEVGVGLRRAAAGLGVAILASPPPLFVEPSGVNVNVVSSSQTKSWVRGARDRKSTRLNSSHL